MRVKLIHTYIHTKILSDRLGNPKKAELEGMSFTNVGQKNIYKDRGLVYTQVYTSTSIYPEAY
jgi:hypothetical protein